MFEKIKYKIVFVRKEYNTINIIKVVKLANISNVYKFNNKTFTLNLSTPLFAEKLVKTYIIDFDSGSQLLFDEIKPQLNPEQLDMIISNRIIREITSGLMSDKTDKIIAFVFGLIIGGLVVAVLLMGYFQSKIEELLANSSNVVNLNPISVKNLWGLIRK
jgi:hypothetical protein